ncbi:hypothetical protein [Martelella limonii]|uniref:hypothetical protein n=1 Tax=Martelella limonii TaxID=1647649 RepID=UPI001580E7EA|nr:hypothetical protein [Martelella limonii]
MPSMPQEAMALAERLCAGERLAGDRLAATVLALALLDLARDSRTAARLAESAHALVLRAVTTLAAEPALLDLRARDQRTMRQHYVPTILAMKALNDFKASNTLE